MTWQRVVKLLARTTAAEEQNESAILFLADFITNK